METLWQSRVLVKYNNEPEQLAKIEEIREICSSLIDLLNEHKNNLEREIGEKASPEKLRLYATAMTEIEWACMWSIKAICK